MAGVSVSWSIYLTDLRRAYRARASRVPEHHFSSDAPAQDANAISTPGSPARHRQGEPSEARGRGNGFRGINGLLPAKRVPSIYSTIHCLGRFCASLPVSHGDVPEDEEDFHALVCSRRD